MKRITTDNVCEMGIVGLAHNCCYIGKDGYARYRDFDVDMDARELAKELLKELAKQDVDFESDEDFDDWIGSCYGEDGIGTINGLIAMFYQNIWAMAELRENLKRYEDLEEKGRMLVLPCKVGDAVFMVVTKRKKYFKKELFSYVQQSRLTWHNMQRVLNCYGETVFLTREEAEAALEKMGGGEK
ncbi:MAG: hypothetical protein ACI4TP_06790 [Anaerotignum sp.]